MPIEGNKLDVNNENVAQIKKISPTGIQTKALVHKIDL